MATINGRPINFGFQGGINATGGQGIDITGVTGMLIQALDQSVGSEVERVKDGNGNEVVNAYSNIKRTLKLDAIISGTSLATAIIGVSYAIANPGTFVAITGCTSAPGIVGVSWVLESGSVAQSNTTAAKMSMTLTSLAGITAAAT